MSRLPPVDLPIDSLEKAQAAARAALEKHAEGVTVLDLRGLSSVTDYFVIGTGHSGPQLRALTEAVAEVFRRHGWPVWHQEGTPAAGSGSPGGPAWVLLDCGDVVVHLLNEPARRLYRLEALWAEAPRVPAGPPTAAAQPPSDVPASSRTPRR